MEKKLNRRNINNIEKEKLIITMILLKNIYLIFYKNNISLKKIYTINKN